MAAMVPIPINGPPNPMMMGSDPGGGWGSPDIPNLVSTLATLPPLRYPAKEIPPTKDFQDEAQKYIASWMKASRSYVQAKKDRWELYEALYLSKLGISDWQAWRNGAKPQDTSQSRSIFPIVDDAGNSAEGQLWQSQYVHSPSPFVDNYCDNAFSQIFGGAEWCSIISETPDNNANPITPPDINDQTPGTPFNKSQRIQHLLLQKLDLAQSQARIYEAIQSCVMLGTVYAKVFWHSRAYPNEYWDVGISGVDHVQAGGQLYEYPVIQMIPLDRILPDKASNHNDVQRWSGIGHTVDRQYEEILAGFETGQWKLNKKEFTDRWNPESFKGEMQSSDHLYEDPDALTEADDRNWLQCWEWHGRVPFKGKLQEVVAVIVTELTADDPSDGVLIHLSTRSVLPSGVRPFVCAHFTQRPGAFGVGVIEREEDILYTISQFIGQAQDNARLTSNPIFECDMSSPAYRTIQKNGGRLSPGLVIPRIPGDPNSGINAAKLPPFPSNEIGNMVGQLTGIVERHTNVSDVQQGLAGDRKTATESSILQAQGSVPLRAKVNLFARSFLEPALNIALEMVCQFTSEDQTFVVQGANNQDLPVSVTLDELQSGKYRACVTLLRQDHTSIAKAQSIERALPILANSQGMLQQEGVRVSFSELVSRYLDLIGIEGADRIIQPAPPPPPMPIMGPPGAGPGGPPPQPPQGPPGPPPNVLPGGNGPTIGPRPPMGGGPPPSPPPVGGPLMPPQPIPVRIPPQLVRRGGPMGPNPTDQNAIAQALQLQALENQGGMP